VLARWQLLRRAQWYCCCISWQLVEGTAGADSSTTVWWGCWHLAWYAARVQAACVPRWFFLLLLRRWLMLAVVCAEHRQGLRVLHRPSNTLQEIQFSCEMGHAAHAVSTRIYAATIPTSCAWMLQLLHISRPPC
jgi:hypothetical protein